MQHRSSYNLPRKYRIAFSGCSADCAFASVADLGFFAHTNNGRKGFAVYSGGGLGPNPQVGIKIEDFIRDDEIFEVAEAVKRLFDEHGDRSNRHRARLRYVVARLGPEEFPNLYKATRTELRRGGTFPQHSRNTRFRPAFQDSQSCGSRGWQPQAQLGDGVVRNRNA